MKTLDRIACVTLATAALAAPAAAFAYNPMHSTDTHASDTSAQHDTARTDSNEPPAEAVPGSLREAVQIDQTIDRPVRSGCTYHATLRGTVTPVHDNHGNSADLQRLRPDLRIGATIRCPGSTEAHIQERRVVSTGVMREELEQQVQLNASIDRMQNSGRCMYVPVVAFTNTQFAVRDVRYMCPNASGGERGGGPTAVDRDDTLDATSPRTSGHARDLPTAR